MSYIITIDQGTTGSRVFIIDAHGQVKASVYEEFTQHFPNPGWVEHDANEIWASLEKLLSAAIEKAKVNPKDAAGIGITNQRETSLVWDVKSGTPVHNAIVWQCRRTSAYCDQLKNQGLANMFKEKTGLVLDAYFSGTKLHWLLENVPGLKEKATRKDVIFGTIDTFLLFKLTGEHKTDYTNASRTLMYNIYKKEWDSEILKILNIPEHLLPNVQKSSSEFGRTKNLSCLPDGIPVYSMVGDQQSALFGQLCFEKGQVKNTYGTGCFMLMNLGDKPIASESGLLTTLACGPTGEPTYALEGSVFIGGAVIQFLRDSLKFFGDAAETDQMAKNVNIAEDPVVFVPAFAGLGAPYWDQDARGAILGLSRDTSIAQITRAALKSIAFQSYELLQAMKKDAGMNLDLLKVDGGATKNNYLMQFQSDLINVPIEIPQNAETTVLGAAYLAGLAAGLWTSTNDLKNLNPPDKTFTPNMKAEIRNHELQNWQAGVKRVLTNQ